MSEEPLRTDAHLGKKTHLEGRTRNTLRDAQLLHPRSEMHLMVVNESQRYSVNQSVRRFCEEIVFV